MKGGNSLLIHRMPLDDHYVVLDVNSGAVHIIDNMIYDILLQKLKRSPGYGAEKDVI